MHKVIANAGRWAAGVLLVLLVFTALAQYKSVAQVAVSAMLSFLIAIAAGILVFFRGWYEMLECEEKIRKESSRA